MIDEAPLYRFNGENEREKKAVIFFFPLMHETCVEYRNILQVQLTFQVKRMEKKIK